MNDIDRLRAEIERQDLELEATRALAATFDDEDIFVVSDECDERVGALVDQLTLSKPKPFALGVRV